MKNFILSLFLGFMVFGLSSCNLEDNKNPQVHQGIVTVVIGGNNPLFRTDNGTSLYCTNAVTDTSYAMKTGDRVFIYYTFGDTTVYNNLYYPINLSAYTKATIKAFATVQPDETDPYGNKSLMGINMLGISGNYLNVAFCSYMSASDPNTYELIRMKKYENNTIQDTDPQIYFELRHNTAQVNMSYYSLKAFSFNLSPLYEEFPSATKFKINLKWVAGNKVSYSDMIYVPQE